MIDSLPTISVVIPAYNSAEFLPYSIRSVLSQTFKPYEIIVVDDCSTDNTRKVLEPFMQRIHYINSGKNRGSSFARNTGIQASKGKYIAFLDADDIWLPQKLQTNLKCFEADPELAMVYSRHLNIDKEGKVTGESPKQALPSGTIFSELFSEQNFILTSTVMVRREVFDTTGLFDEQLFNCQDWDLFLRVAYHFKCKGINTSLVQYRQTPQSLSKNRDSVLQSQKLVIDQIYEAFKGKKNGITEKCYRKRLASHYAKSGRYYVKMGDKGNARKRFRLSLQYDPLNFRTLRYYLFRS
ncbi:MAG: glycosyltransferase [Candidatus Brocadiaceae bacterium]|nr:glycosyltransferase [Candidatus Brocadiaceae bacterium]